MSYRKRVPRSDLSAEKQVAKAIKENGGHYI